MFIKDLNDLTLKDLQDLVSTIRYAEGDQLEYKSTLSANGEEQDPWIKGIDKVGNTALEKLASELIAFANTHGGTLLLGIDEDRETPRRPTKITPVPRALELREKLIQSLQATITPSLNTLTSKVIETGEGFGVIVFQVGRSDRAPHRYEKTKDAYIRRDSSCQKMTMEEIQHLSVKRIRQQIEGFWVVKFGSGGAQNGGVVVLENGRVFGGDSSYFYTGMFEKQDENQIIATLEIQHYYGDKYTAFGTYETRFNASLFGQVSDKKIIGILKASRGEIAVTMQKIKNI